MTENHSIMKAFDMGLLATGTHVGEAASLLRDIAEGRTLGDHTTLRDTTVMVALEQRIAAAQVQED